MLKTRKCWNAKAADAERGKKKSNCHILTHSYTLFRGDRQLVLFSAIHRGDKRNILVQQKLIIANSLWTSSSVEKTIANFVGNGVFFFFSDHCCLKLQKYQKFSKASLWLKGWKLNNSLIYSLFSRQQRNCIRDIWKYKKHMRTKWFKVWQRTGRWKGNIYFGDTPMCLQINGREKGYLLLANCQAPTMCKPANYTKIGHRFILKVA